MACSGGLSAPKLRGHSSQVKRSTAPVRWQDMLWAAVAAVAVALVLKTFVIDFSRVSSASMAPTLLPGDYVLISKVAYAIGLPSRLPLVGLLLPEGLRWWYRMPRRWDVVVLDFPGMPGQVRPDTPQYLLKRVVGLPGDTLRFNGDTLVINHTAYLLPGMQQKPQRLVVPYRGMRVQLSARTLSQWLPLLQREGRRVELRNDTVFLDGIPTTSYTVQQDYFFLMGDNYRTSWDSRHWGVVPQQVIVGKAVVIYYSRADNGRVRWNRIGHFLH